MVLLLHSTEEQLQRVETSFCTNPISESWTLPNPRSSHEIDSDVKPSDLYSGTIDVTHKTRDQRQQ